MIKVEKHKYLLHEELLFSASEEEGLPIRDFTEYALKRLEVLEKRYPEASCIYITEEWTIKVLKEESDEVFHKRLESEISYLKRNLNLLEEALIQSESNMEQHV